MIWISVSSCPNAVGYSCLKAADSDTDSIAMPNKLCSSIGEWMSGGFIRRSGIGYSTISRHTNFGTSPATYLWHWGYAVSGSEPYKISRLDCGSYSS